MNLERNSPVIRLHALVVWLKVKWREFAFIHLQYHARAFVQTLQTIKRISALNFVFGIHRFSYTAYYIRWLPVILFRILFNHLWRRVCTMFVATIINVRYFNEPRVQLGSSKGKHCCLSLLYTFRGPILDCRVLFIRPPLKSSIPKEML